MVLKVAPRSMTWFADAVDRALPDDLRLGDTYDLASGRFALQTWARFNPFVELADSVSVRRAREQDLTSSGLGFELMIVHQGDTWNAIVHLPAADHPAWQTGKLPVFIDAPGFADAPRAHTKRSGLSEAAVQSGAVSVALGGSRSSEGIPMVLLRSHDGMDSRGQRMKAADGAALVRFVLAQLEPHVQSFAREHGLPNVTLDREDALIDGLSNGGALAALAVASGAARHGISFSGPTSHAIRDLAPGEPVTMIFVAGAEDRLVPPGGPHGHFSADFVPPEEAAQIFADHNGTGPLSSDALPDFLARLVQPGVTVKASGDRTRGLAAYIHIDDLGHAVPGSSGHMISESMDRHAHLSASAKVSGAELVQDVLRWIHR